MLNFPFSDCESDDEGKIMPTEPVPRREEEGSVASDISLGSRAAKHAAEANIPIRNRSQRFEACIGMAIEDGTELSHLETTRKAKIRLKNCWEWDTGNLET